MKYLFRTFCIGLLTTICGCNRAEPAQKPVVPDPSPQVQSGTADQVETQQGTTVHTNQLAGETSPYLLQHAHNPVNWYPWGPAAFAKAKAENKPIFLSVGYSTCYWCHVMERESFEKDDVAKILNEYYIAIKVDREERPEVDQQFMIATQLVSGRGGWPNSVWLTPDAKPWMAGTYFPRERFKSILLQLAGAWKNQHDVVLAQADRMMAEIDRVGNVKLEAKPVSQSLIAESVEGAQSTFDSIEGGFGSKPKFPPHDQLALLFDQYQRQPTPNVATMIETTLTKMARGGVYDQLGGGFHRYSTDGQWLLPHFEKMLYDNGQLIRSYTDAYLQFKDQEYRDTVEGIFVWLQREMTSPEGGFYSAIDSESDAEEGKFYVWTYQEVLDVLGPEEGKLFAEIYDIQPNGNFKEEATGQVSHSNIPHLNRSISEIATQKNLDPTELAKRLAGMRSQLLDVRQKRKYPHLDDKVVAAWNGLMIEGLAYAGRTLEEPKYVAAAQKAADFILNSMMKDGKIQRTWRAGQSKLNGYLNDYAFVAGGMIELYRATDDKKYLDAAQSMADTMLSDFQDQTGGGFYFTSATSGDGETNYVLRSKNLSGGGNLPSGNGEAARVLFELANLTGEKKYQAAAEKTVEGLSGYLWRSAGQADRLLVAAAIKLDGSSSETGAAPGRATDSDPKATPDDNGTEADSTFEAHAVEGQVYQSQLKLTPGQSFQVAVRLSIKPGWHLYGPNPEASVVSPSSVRVDESDAVDMIEVKPPTGVTKVDDVLGEELETYEGEVTFLVDLKVPSDAKNGKSSFALTVKTQACDDSQCAAPAQNNVVLNFEVVDKTGTTGNARHPKIFKQ